MPTTKNIRETVHRVIKELVEESGKTVPPLDDDRMFMDCGLDSLGVAQLFAVLDGEFNVLAFDADENDMPVTIGDLIKVYEKETARVATS